MKLKLAGFAVVLLVLALAPEGNVGRARYELRVAGPKLAAQL